MTAAAFLLVCCAVLTKWINLRQVRIQDARQRKQAEQPLSKEGGFQLIFRDRYLLLIALLVIILNIVNSSGEFLLSKLVVGEAARAFPDAIRMAADRQRYIGEFYGSYFAWFNVTGLILQMFFVSRIFGECSSNLQMPIKRHSAPSYLLKAREAGFAHNGNRLAG